MNKVSIFLSLTIFEIWTLNYFEYLISSTCKMSITVLLQISISKLFAELFFDSFRSLGQFVTSVRQVAHHIQNENLRHDIYWMVSGWWIIELSVGHHERSEMLSLKYRFLAENFFQAKLNIWGNEWNWMNWIQYIGLSIDIESKCCKPVHKARKNISIIDFWNSILFNLLYRCNS